MERIKIENFSFKYPVGERDAIHNISLEINQGEFICICGKSGCGKSTLLRNLKPALAPHGTHRGKILLGDTEVSKLPAIEQISKIGFVLQNPDTQIVTDKVWHEMAFGLENIGVKTDEIRARVAEMATFFGVEGWFYKDTSELSGGQKQLLNLASIMVMGPSVLILDEPTSQLDPIAAREFLETVLRLNKEFGITVIMSEHRLEEVFTIADRVVVMEDGGIIADGTPSEVGGKLKELKNDMFLALPATMRVYSSIAEDKNFPVSVRDGRRWLIDYSAKNNINTEIEIINSDKNELSPMVKLTDIWFRYEQGGEDIVKDLSFTANSGEIYAIMGGNGAGKSTLLSIISGNLKVHRGKVLRHSDKIAVLPQNPQTLFLKKTVKLDIESTLEEIKISKEEKDKRISEIISFCQIGGLLSQHPYDLSGGEQQRIALAKILLLSPQILLLDEPTKGLDAHFKERLANMLIALKKIGVCIVIVSHDIEFCARYADKCGLMFDGKIEGLSEPREFFSTKNFYTTAASRMSRGVINNAILAEDIITACGGKSEENREGINIKMIEDAYKQEKELNIKKDKKKERKRISPIKIIVGVIFTILFAVTYLCFNNAFEDARINIVYAVELMLAGLSIASFLPIKNREVKALPQKTKRGNKWNTIFSLFIILIVVPLTIFAGMYFFGDRKYYFISMMIIIETMLPFVFAFENRKPTARELIIVSVLCALTVCGRIIFSMTPQFKPTLALIIISGIAFGGETGFLVGAVSAFVSNFFFGQGAWTQWQMFASGMVGFLAGLIFNKGTLQKNRIIVALFGGLSALIIYGVIVNVSHVIMFEGEPTMTMILASCVMGFPYDLIHAASTMFFLWFLTKPMLEKLERVKTKYGIDE